MPADRSETAAAERERRRLVHREVEGSRAATGPTIDLTGQPDWEADTACGERVRTSRVTRREASVTCPACAESGRDGRKT